MGPRYVHLLTFLLVVMSSHVLAKEIPECTIPVKRSAYEMSDAGHRFELYQCLKANAAEATRRGEHEKAKMLNAEAEAVSASCG